MKYVLIGFIVASLAFAACGTDQLLQGPPGRPGVNGSDGATGPQGPQGETGPAGAAAVIEVIDPCGDAPGVYDEVILRLANGQLLSSFSDNSNGKNTRFSILTPGSYMTTDGSSCRFNVDPNNAVTF